MKRFLIVTVLLLAGAVSAAPLRADLLTFSPLNQVVSLNSTANVTIVFDTPIVGDFDLVVNWNPAIIAFDSFTLGTQLGDVSLGEAFSGSSSTASSLGVFEFSFLTALELAGLQGVGPISFFSIRFDAIGVGTSPLTFSPPDGIGFIPIGDENGIQRTFTFEAGSIRVTDDGVPGVPEPASLLLLSSGLTAIWIRMRRRA
jgi:hypothetical protein